MMKSVVMTKEDLIRRVVVDPDEQEHYLKAGRDSFEGITLFPPESETFMPLVRTPQERWALLGKSVARSWFEVGNGLRKAMDKEQTDQEVLKQKGSAARGQQR